MQLGAITILQIFTVTILQIFTVAVFLVLPVEAVGLAVTHVRQPDAAGSRYDITDIYRYDITDIYRCSISRPPR